MLQEVELLVLGRRVEVCPLIRSVVLLDLTLALTIAILLFLPKGGLVRQRLYCFGASFVSESTPE